MKVGSLFTLTCMCVFTAGTERGISQTDLLVNGSFQTLDASAHFPPWTLSGRAQPLVAPGTGNFCAGSRGTAESAAAVQNFSVPALPPGPLRIISHASVLRRGVQPAPVQLQLTLEGQQPVALNAQPGVVADDGGFHPVVATTVLPSLPAQAQFSIRSATGAGTEWRVDDVTLTVVPLPFQTPTPAGAAGSVIQLTGASLQPGMAVSIGGVAAPVLNSQAGLIVVRVPAPPQGHEPDAWQGITVTGAGGVTQTDPAAFRWLLPITVNGAQPAVASAAGGSRVRVTGAAFPADVRLTRPGSPGLPPVFPDFIESSGALVFTVPASAGPSETWRLESPSRLASPGAQFNLQMAAPPSVAALSPDNGPPAGGTAVNVTGSGFVAGAQVYFDDKPAAAATVVSPLLIQAVTPPHQMEHTRVRVVNPTGVASSEPLVFRYIEGVRGDVNGDNRVDLADVIQALESVTDAAPPGPLNLASDVNADGRIGLPEAAAALRLAETGDPGTFLLHPPELLLSSSIAAAGEEVFATVAGGHPLFEPFTLFWGDGERVELSHSQAAGQTPHVFRPGTWQVRLLCSYGFTPAVTLTVSEPPLLTGASLVLHGTSEDGQPVSGTSGRLMRTSPVSVTLTLQAARLPATPVNASGFLSVTSAKLTTPIMLPWSGQFTVLPDGTGTFNAGFTLPVSSWTAPGEYFVKLLVNEGPGGPGVIPPNGVTFALSGYVTEEDCRVLERQHQEMKLAKAAKVNECDELKKRLEDCQRQLAGLQAARAAAQAALNGINGELTAKQAAYTALFNAVKSFLGGAGTLTEYPAGAAPPAGGQFAGARKNGASAGVGISFGAGGSGAQELLDRMDAYEKANGHSIGKDLNKLRDCIAQMDGLKAQKAEKEAEIAGLDGQIAALNAAIAAKQAALAACMAQCAALEQQIADLEAAHATKLEQLKRQREAEEAITESEDRAADAERKAGQSAGEADAAGNTIAGRSGTPGQVGGDSTLVNKGRDCEAIARQKLAQARAKQAEARAALASGDTATAKAKAAEADVRIAEANTKLDEGRECILKGLTSALGRKPRECPDGLFVTGSTTSWVVWDRITDISLTPMDVPPEKWASTLEHANAALKGIQKFLEFFELIEKAAEAVGVDVPIGGPVTPDAGEVAETIVNAWLEIFKQTQPYDVWAELTGHTEWSRTDRLCVNGCWTYQPVSGSLADTVKRKCKIGTIWGGDRASRKAQLQEILSKVDRTGCQ